MIPSYRWFPMSIAARAAWFNNFSTQFAAIGAGLGFTPTEITAVADDNAAYQFAALESQKAEAFIDAVRLYRRIITEGAKGDPTPDFPTPPAPGITPSAETGVFERLDALVKRIRVAPNYTDEAGALLGILSSKPGSVSPDEMQPILTARAEPNHLIKVEFIRGKTDGIALQLQLDNGLEWTEAGNYFKSPASITVQNGTAGQPRAVRVRARYLLANTPVGQNSDTVNVVTIP